MKIIKINPKRAGKEEVGEIVRAIKEGKTIAYPTDTVYGLGGDASNARVIQRIYKIKQRDRKYPLIILVGSFKMLSQYCRVNKVQKKYLKNVWPGPVTAVLESWGRIPRTLSAGEDSLAIRLPKSDFLGKILKKLDAPLISTSLNISGREPISDLSKISQYFGKNKPDLVIDGGKLRKKRPSRLVDLRNLANNPDKSGKAIILRK